MCKLTKDYRQNIRLVKHNLTPLVMRRTFTDDNKPDSTILEERQRVGCNLIQLIQHQTCIFLGKPNFHRYNTIQMYKAIHRFIQEKWLSFQTASYIGKK